MFKLVSKIKILKILPKVQETWTQQEVHVIKIKTALKIKIKVVLEKKLQNLI